MCDIADTMNLGILDFRGPLPPGKIFQIRHESLNEALEKCHGRKDLRAPTAFQ